jgi:hypothetical protein
MEKKKGKTRHNSHTTLVVKKDCVTQLPSLPLSFFSFLLCFFFPPLGSAVFASSLL